jgi:hypothetical protein
MRCITYWPTLIDMISLNFQKHCDFGRSSSCSRGFRWLEIGKADASCNSGPFDRRRVRSDVARDGTEARLRAWSPIKPSESPRLVIECVNFDAWQICRTMVLSVERRRNRTLSSLVSDPCRELLSYFRLLRPCGRAIALAEALPDGRSRRLI